MTEPSPDRPRPFPIRPGDLLQHARTAAVHYPPLVYSGDAPPAEEIARVLAGLPFPSEADFRRAVSAAYYALFHAVTLQAAAFLVPGDGFSERYRYARGFEHRDVRNVSLWVTDSGTPPERLAGMVELARSEPQVRVVATATRLLDNERRVADYDHFAEFTQNRALRAVNRADQAVELTERPAFAQGSGGRAFLRLLAEQARTRA